MERSSSHAPNPFARFPPGGHVTGDVVHRLQGQLRVGDHGEVRREDATELARFYVYVDELAVSPVSLQVPGMAVAPAVADADHQVALQEERVGVTLAGLEPDDPHVEGMVFGDHTLAHVRRTDRNL